MTPEAEDEQLPVLLSQVFVPQLVRAKPAVVECRTRASIQPDAADGEVW
jgi:hypothetical protein